MLATVPLMPSTTTAVAMTSFTALPRNDRDIHSS
jgi:hypothetical protein